VSDGFRGKAAPMAACMAGIAAALIAAAILAPPAIAASLFLNMILFQVFWNMLTFADLGHPSGFLEFFGRLFFLCFIALLIYFPPRMFYLAEDIHRRRTWLTMLLANSPVIIRVLIGTSSNTPGW